MFFIVSFVNRVTTKTPATYSAKSMAAVISVFFLLSSQAAQAKIVNFDTENAQYQLRLSAPVTPALNTIYRWKAVIKSAQKLNNISLSDITISGGMAAHGHGLPTAPKALNLRHVTDNQISFDIQGLKFQMWGQWHVIVSVAEDEAPLIVDFVLTP